MKNNKWLNSKFGELQGWDKQEEQAKKNIRRIKQEVAKTCKYEIGQVINARSSGVDVKIKITEINADTNYNFTGFTYSIWGIKVRKNDTVGVRRHRVLIETCSSSMRLFSKPLIDLDNGTETPELNL